MSPAVTMPAAGSPSSGLPALSSGMRYTVYSPGVRPTNVTCATPHSSSLDVTVPKLSTTSTATRRAPKSTHESMGNLRSGYASNVHLTTVRALSVQSSIGQLGSLVPHAASGRNKARHDSLLMIEIPPRIGTAG